MSWANETGARLYTESHSQRPKEGGVGAEEVENAAKELQHEQEIPQREHAVRTALGVAPMES